MSNVIRCRRAVTTAQSSEPSAQSSSVATAPALMDHLAVGPVGSQAPASSASSVAQPVSTRQRHRPTSTTDTTSTDASGSQPGIDFLQLHRINIGYDERHRAAPTAKLHSSLAHDIGHVVRTRCLMQWKSWKVMPDEIKTETNYNLENLNDESLTYVNRLNSKRKVAPKEFEGREDSWAWLCAHFQALDFVNKAKVSKGIGKGGRGHIVEDGECLVEGT
ncbi:unnamed protein product [Prunus armeniaca]